MIYIIFASLRHYSNNRKNYMFPHISHFLLYDNFVYVNACVVNTFERWPPTFKNGSVSKK